MKPWTSSTLSGCSPLAFCPHRVASASSAAFGLQHRHLQHPPPPAAACSSRLDAPRLFAPHLHLVQLFTSSISSPRPSLRSSPRPALFTSPRPALFTSPRPALFTSFSAPHLATLFTSPRPALITSSSAPHLATLFTSSISAPHLVHALHLTSSSAHHLVQRSSPCDALHLVHLRSSPRSRSSPHLVQRSSPRPALFTLRRSSPRPTHVFSMPVLPLHNLRRRGTPMLPTHVVAQPHYPTTVARHVAKTFWQTVRTRVVDLWKDLKLTHDLYPPTIGFVHVPSQIGLAVSIHPSDAILPTPYMGALLSYPIFAGYNISVVIQRRHYVD
ncbi:uncharacterized protein UTRI_10266 [Ustilago trichophora]|uniref:Uncharacterized protein n=1 Tax=Ustilago trichophora TaxID=86804 RepID=A0A5C3ELJ6_9BASI|nr:uncharacterized protein UTRI_10266 [Ustilago trichophora]